MEIIKKLKSLRFLLVICVANMVMSFLLEPVRGSSGTMWAEYYQEDEIDIAFVGASFSAAAFAPYVVDEVMEINSFNMGTPLQAIGQTLSAVKTLIEDHDVDTIVLGTGFFVFQYETLDKAELTFEMARASKETGMNAVADSLSYIWSEDVRNTEKSINYFFPWIYNHEEITGEYIFNNISSKMAAIGDSLSGNGERIPKESLKGFRPYSGVVDYSKRWEINSYCYYDQSFLEDKVEQFKEILNLCRENEIDIIVVNTPHPAYDVVSCYQTYEESEQEMESICGSYGVDYYNFSLARPELYDPVPEYYYDFEHLNLEGAEVFSKSLCKLLKMRGNGEETEKYFYSVEEYFKIHSDLIKEWMLVQVPK